MRKKSEPVKDGAHPLVGKWCHSYEPDQPEVIRWQGHILAEVATGQFLVQLFEWFMGDPTKQIIVPLADMAKWDFYNTNEDMNFAYEKYSERRGRLEKVTSRQEFPRPA